MILHSIVAAACSLVSVPQDTRDWAIGNSTVHAILEHNRIEPPDSTPRARVILLSAEHTAEAAIGQRARELAAACSFPVEIVAPTRPVDSPSLAPLAEALAMPSGEAPPLVDIVAIGPPLSDLGPLRTSARVHALIIVGPPLEASAMTAASIHALKIVPCSFVELSPERRDTTARELIELAILGAGAAGRAHFIDGNGAADSVAPSLVAGELARWREGSLTAAIEKRIGAELDDFHAAAAAADGVRYFAHFTEDGVFLGTDATERWTVPQFKAYCEPYFSKGKGWTYVPKERHVAIRGDLAWFDEALDNAKYGGCRGSGVLQLVDGRWKIAQYNLTLTVPNDVASKVVDVIRGK